MDDMKDLILVLGGAIFLIVIFHGCWLAWRKSRAPVVVKIESGLIPEDDEGIDHLRGELPSGGARVVGPEQVRMSFDAEALREPSAPEETAPEETAAAESAPAPIIPSRTADPAPIPRGAVPIIADRGPKADAAAQPEAAAPEPERSAARPPEAAALAAPEAVAEAPAAAATSAPIPESASQPAPEPAKAPAREGDMLILRLTASEEAPFAGEPLVEALRSRGLKYGEMNIFHRRDPQSAELWFSVANLVEPGHFDLAKLSEFVTPGLVFFLRLPGPGDPNAALQEMVEVASSMASELGGMLRDENMNPWNGPALARYHQRLAAFSGISRPR